MSNKPDDISASPATGRSRTFRVFVSSTFEDLKEERNRLHETVYPRLRAFCQERGASFQAIDLRWGVSEEASFDQQTMKICLGEIDRCLEVTPRPNFLVLLGQRYGWVPPPAEIPNDEFEQILGVCDPADRQLLVFDCDRDGDETGWYRLDKNASNPVWLLQPRTEEFRDAQKWGETEAELQRALQGAVDTLSFADEQKVKYTASATEQEIRTGALQVPDAEGKVFSFFRTIDGAREDDDRLVDGATVFVDQDEDPITALKTKLNPTWEYSARWDPEEQRPEIQHLDELAERVEAALKAAIQKELDEPTEASGAAEERHVEPAEEFDAEGRAHCRFANGLLQFFVGRQEPTPIRCHLPRERAPENSRDLGRWRRGQVGTDGQGARRGPGSPRRRRDHLPFHWCHPGFLRRPHTSGQSVQRAGATLWGR